MNNFTGQNVKIARGPLPKYLVRFSTYQLWLMMEGCHQRDNFCSVLTPSLVTLASCLTFSKSIRCSRRSVCTGTSAASHPGHPSSSGPSCRTAVKWLFPSGKWWDSLVIFQQLTKTFRNCLCSNDRNFKQFQMNKYFSAVRLSSMCNTEVTKWSLCHQRWFHFNSCLLACVAVSLSGRRVSVECSVWM